MKAVYITVGLLILIGGGYFLYNYMATKAPVIIPPITPPAPAPTVRHTAAGQVFDRAIITRPPVGMLTNVATRQVVPE